MPTEINRSDPKAAAEIMKAFSRSKMEQKIVLAQLLRSAELAEDIALNCWSVSLLPTGFRLNVGPVEVFAYLSGTVRLLLLGSLPENSEKLGQIVPSEYRSVPQPQHAFVDSPKILESAYPMLEKAHEAFIRAAALKSDGRPKKSSYARYHSPGLLAYADEVVGIEKPTI